MTRYPYVIVYRRLPCAIHADDTASGMAHLAGNLASCVSVPTSTRTDPLAEAAARDAEVVQFFLDRPAGLEDARCRAPTPRSCGRPTSTSTSTRRTSINVATLNNRIRIPSRKLLSAHAEAAAAIGAKGLIVHGGHISKGDDPAVGFDNWRKAFAQAADEGGFPTPILIENTAGGDYACARRFDAIARLWDAVGDFGVGFCLDTCHAHAGGEDLVDIVDRVKAITGRIDLVHANDSKDPFDSGRDRHDNFGQGQIDPKLIVEVVRAAGRPGGRRDARRRRRPARRHRHAARGRYRLARSTGDGHQASASAGSVPTHRSGTRRRTSPPSGSSS